MDQRLPVRFNAIRRKPVAVSRETLVTTGFLDGFPAMPLVTEPRTDNVNPFDWAQTERELIESQLLKHGAILFRNFKLESVDQFERFVSTISPGLIEYHERS